MPNFRSEYYASIAAATIDATALARYAELDASVADNAAAQSGSNVNVAPALYVQKPAGTDPLD